MPPGARGPERVAPSLPSPSSQATCLTLNILQDNQLRDMHRLEPGLGRVILDTPIRSPESGCDRKALSHIECREHAMSKMDADRPDTPRAAPWAMLRIAPT